MQSHAKLLGHPIHPMLVAFPIGLFVVGLAFDLIAFAGGPAALGYGAFWCILGGIVMGLGAASVGLVDWLAIPRGTRAKRIGLWHAGTNVIVVALFAISWLTRLGSAGFAPSGLTVGLQIAGIVLLFVAGWLGGELVDRLGVGVDDGAHLDASSSLATPRA
jgi:uncharacterized membrane protein